MALRAHSAELRAAREEAASAAAAAAAVAVARGTETASLGEGDGSWSSDGGDRGGGGTRAMDGSVAAVREMRDATARLQEGELVAVRKLLASSERKQQTLVEQLAAERLERNRAAAEATRLQALATEYGKLHERHEAALEMLGEQAEQRQKLEEELETIRGKRT